MKNKIKNFAGVFLIIPFLLLWIFFIYVGFSNIGEDVGGNLSLFLVFKILVCILSFWFLIARGTSQSIRFVSGICLFWAGFLITGDELVALSSIGTNFAGILILCLFVGAIIVGIIRNIKEQKNQKER